MERVTRQSPEAGLSFIWKVIQPFRGRAALVMALVLMDTALASLGIGMVLPVFQAILAPEQSHATLSRIAPILTGLTPEARMLWLAGVTVGVFAMKAAASLTSIAMARDFSERLRQYWISRIGERYLLGTYASLQREKQGVLINNWFNESTAAARFFVAYLSYLSSLVLALALTALGLLVNWKAMLAFMVFGAVVVLLLRHRAFGAMARLGQLKLRLSQSINATMAESLAHIRDLKLLSAELARLALLDARSRDLRSVFVRIAVMSEIPRAAGEFLAVAALMALLVGGIALLGASPRDLLPVLAFFFIAFYRLVTAGSQAISGRMKALSDLHSVRVVHRLSHEAGQHEDRDSGLPIDSLNTDIRFEGVAFAYESAQPVIRDLSVAIPRGKLTFLVGPSGAGKSTLLDLLLRLHRPTAGRIVANGRDIAEFNLVQWRRRFGYVSQEATLFNGSIRMNLLLAKPDAAEEELFEACRLAGADDFIRSFPNDYDTAVGDRGHTLSGGQRKRIAIARALMTRPQVLILDEATTSFEQALERTLIKRIAQAIPDLTVIQITHRLQTASNADLIVVLDHGRVAASGSWDEIRSRGLDLFIGTE
jgi:ABC-type multidrug transport system fused ATPase/permease subunit